MNTLTIFIIFTPIFVISLLLINFIVAINQPDSEKLSPYECGMNPLGDARSKFSIQFFLVAILFLIFDLEIIFLFPFAVSLYHVSFYGFWIVIIFLIVLTIGFIFEFSIGALKFHNPSKNSPPLTLRASFSSSFLSSSSTFNSFSHQFIRSYSTDNSNPLILVKLYSNADTQK
jgi:NADH-ubiquinone oxidoreductase chain 3